MSNDPLHALKIAFRARMQADADALETAMAGGPNWARIEAVVHGLAGSAGIFGEADIGLNARLLDEVFGEAHRPSAGQVQALIDLIRRRAVDHS